MDGMIVAILIYFVVNMMVKRRKIIQAQQKSKAQPERSGAERSAGNKATQQAQRPKQKNPQAHPGYTAAMPSAAFGEDRSEMNHSLQMRMKETQPRRQEYMGSLGVGSTEGQDVCDPSLGHGPEDDAFYNQSTVYDGEIGSEAMPQWDGKSVLRGVVMSEILKRPSERKWGRV